MTEGAGASGDGLDLLVIGGGVMGLFTAWTAARHGSRVAVLERGRVGDPATASYGRTRSYRRDYLDAGYARLADEAIIRFGPKGADAADVLLQHLPDARQVEDSRTDASLDLVLGNGYAALTPQTDIPRPAPRPAPQPDRVARPCSSK